MMDRRRPAMRSFVFLGSCFASRGRKRREEKKPAQPLPAHSLLGPQINGSGEDSPICHLRSLGMGRGWGGGGGKKSSSNYACIPVRLQEFNDGDCVVILLLSFPFCFAVVSILFLQRRSRSGAQHNWLPGTVQ